MSPELKAAAERLARQILEAADGSAAGGRVVVEVGRLVCEVRVGRRAADRGFANRAGCRAAVLALLRGEGRPLIGKAVKERLKGRFSGGMVQKTLADLTEVTKELVNPKDKKGYSLAGADRSGNPSLFDAYATGEETRTNGPLESAGKPGTIGRVEQKSTLNV